MPRKSLKTWAGAVKDLLDMLASLAKEMEKDFARAEKLIQAVEEWPHKPWPTIKLSECKQVLIDTILKELKDEDDVQ